MMRKFSVIGAGNLGCYLIDALVKEGYILKTIYKKSKSRQFAGAVGDDIRLLVEQADFVIISTQESEIQRAAELTAANSNPKGKIFFHTANALTSEKLKALKKKGAQVASFSPLQTFPEYQAESPGHVFTGIYFLAEGDPAAVRFRYRLQTAFSPPESLTDPREGPQ